MIQYNIRRTSTLLLALAGLLLNGCASHEAPPNSIPLPADMAAHNPMTNNPPEGQPNHLSPEMQAQINHYKSVSQGATPPATANH